jgi:PST family polysaccharide transporter
MPTDVQRLGRQSVRGGSITLLSQAASVSVQLISTIVLARMLSPAEFGIIAMVLAVTSFAGMFRDLGLSSATIQRAELTPVQLSTLYWINVAAGTVLTMIVAALAPLVARFYGRPELVAVTLALSFTFVISSFGSQCEALLTRQMRFGRRAIATLSGSVTTLLVALTMAFHGFSYWALVWGNLAGVLMTSLLLNGLSGWRPQWVVRGAGMRSMLGFGANVTAFNLVNYFARNLDNILIGRFWGADALGLYSRAYQLLMFPITNLRGPIERVAFPAMSRLQGQSDDYRQYYRQVVFGLAFLSMPLTTYLFFGSDFIVDIVLGPKWSGVVPVFSILAVVAFIQPCISTIGLVCLSLGRARLYLWVGVACAAVTVMGFVAGVAWGAVGVASAYAITTYLGVVPITAWAFTQTPIKCTDFLRAVRNPLIASLLAGFVTWQVRGQLNELSSWGTLLVTLPIFGVAYLCVYYLLPAGQQELETLWKMLRSLGIKQPPATNFKLSQVEQVVE